VLAILATGFLLAHLCRRRGCHLVGRKLAMLTPRVLLLVLLTPLRRLGNTPIPPLQVQRQPLPIVSTVKSHRLATTTDTTPETCQVIAVVRRRAFRRIHVEVSRRCVLRLATSRLARHAVILARVDIAEGLHRPSEGDMPAPLLARLAVLPGDVNAAPVRGVGHDLHALDAEGVAGLLEEVRQVGAGERGLATSGGLALWLARGCGSGSGCGLRLPRLACGLKLVFDPLAFLLSLVGLCRVLGRIAVGVDLDLARFLVADRLALVIQGNVDVAMLFGGKCLRVVLCGDTLRMLQMIRDLADILFCLSPLLRLLWVSASLRVHQFRLGEL